MTRNLLPCARIFKEDSSEITEVKIRVPWGHIAGKWWGSTSCQPIIAIHGWQDNCGSFDNLAPILMKSGFSVFCIDFPGHGFSSHLPLGQNYYMVWDGVHYVRRIVKHFSWSEITIIGHSLGGCIAFMYTATFPKDVKKFIGIEVTGFNFRRPEVSILEDFGSSIDRILEMEKTVDAPCFSTDQMLSIVLDVYNGSVDEKRCEILLRRGLKKLGRKEGYIFSRDPRVKEAKDFTVISQTLGFASRITGEVLAIRAGEMNVNQSLDNYSMVMDAIKKSAKRFEQHFIPGEGHHLHLMNANKIAPQIIEFLFK